MISPNFGNSSNSFNIFISLLKNEILIGKVWRNIENIEIYIFSNLFLNKHFESTNIIFSRWFLFH